MISTNRTNFPKSETILVSKSNQAVPSGSLFPASGNGVTLQDGQLAVVCADHNAHIAYGTFLTAANNVAGSGANIATEVNAIKIVQGTPITTNWAAKDGTTSVIKDPIYVSSPVIQAVSPITVTAKAHAEASRSAVLLGNAVGGADDFPITDSTSYQVTVATESRRRDKIFGTENSDAVNAVVKTPVFSTLSISTDAGKVDWFIQNMVYRLNANSAHVGANPNIYAANKPYIAFALDLDGGGTGTALSAITVGTTFNYMVRNGQTLSFTADAAFVQTITNAIANSTPIVNATEIGVVNLSTAGAQAHDTILIVALDEQYAFVTDYDKTNKVRLRVGMNEELYGANRTTRLEHVSFAYEGSGKGRHLRLQYIDYAKKAHWSQQWMGETTTFIDTSNYVNESTNYNVYIIEHRSDMTVNYSHLEQRAHKTIILVPNGDTTTISGLNNILAPWLRSVTNQDIQTFATAPSIF